MAGVRVRHDTERGVPIAIVHPTRKLKEPVLCRKCRAIHEFKTIHLDLDADGATIVSPEVLVLLKQAGFPGLTIENEVATPPAQTVALEGPPGVYTAAVHEYGGKHKRLYVLKNKLFGGSHG